MTFEKGLCCPFCGYEIRDIHNGGDPGPWWSEPDYVRSKKYNHRCEDCEKDFIIWASFMPTFESLKPDDE